MCSVANEAIQKVSDFGDRISHQADEFKKRYEDKRDELQRRAHDQMLHGSHPVADAAYSTLDTARAVRRYVEDTGEWMKAGVRCTQFSCFIGFLVILIKRFCIAYF